MLFNSWQFAVFLPIVFVLYWSSPHRFRWILLLLASYYFYMSWKVKYIILILFTTVASYVAALLLESSSSQKHKKAILVFTLLTCLGVLFVFKYFDFFSESLAAILNVFAIPLHPVTLKLLLPVGISFYTFQTLSYVIDVYRGKVKAEHHLGIYATFISFFPQLVAGPIERTGNLLPQIRAEHCFNYNQATYGLKLMAWGFFKKLVIADNVAVSVDKIYGRMSDYHGFALLLATMLFTIQIYCDFSGYSDIARGSAKLMGIELMENFRSPYFSASIGEFWSRWHISLSTWFRDYVYIPLGGNRVSSARHYFNLIVTFLVSGLWHGANWTYVAWGGVHGLALVAEKALGFRTKERVGSLRWTIKTSSVLLFVAAAWIFFRSPSIAEALYIFQHLFDGISSPVMYLRTGLSAISNKKFLTAIGLLLFLYDYLSIYSGQETITLLNRKNTAIRWCAYLVVGLAVVFFCSKGIPTEFVYFQF